MTTKVRIATIELTANDARYILHTLNEFTNSLHKIIEEDEEGELAHMYANDIMHTKAIYEKVEKIAVRVFDKNALTVSYELL